MVVDASPWPLNGASARPSGTASDVNALPVCALQNSSAPRQVIALPLRPAPDKLSVRFVAWCQMSKKAVLDVSDLVFTGRRPGDYCPHRAVLMAKLASIAYECDFKELANRLAAGGFQLLVCFGEERTKLCKKPNASVSQREPQNSAQGFVAQSGGLVTVVYRGADEPRDLHHSFDGALLPVTTRFGPARIHRGYFKAFYPTKADVFWALQWAMAHGATEAHCVGHSFGGALATLAAALLPSSTSAAPVVASWSFGAPKVCNGSLFTAAVPPYYRHVRGLDVVTALPPRPGWPLSHPIAPIALNRPPLVGDRSEIPDWVKVLFNADGLVYSRIVGKPKLRDHDHLDYVKTLQRTAKRHKPS
jgi:pimeloyl-ACP methyl ester carboxylesterase